MWSLGQKAYKSGKLPSECLPGIAEITNDWGIYCFDNAILYFCTTIENASNERKEVKAGKTSEWRNVYDFEDLLDDDFRLPRPPSKLQKRQEGAANLLGLASDPRSGVKLWREKKPGEA
jgi:hypothetical protein